VPDPERRRRRNGDTDGWDPRKSAAALNEDRTWPTTKNEPTKRFEPLDVDRYNDRAVVLGLFRGLTSGFHSDIFVRREGRWDYRAGGGGGSDAFRVRWQVGPHPSAPLQARTKGWILGGLCHAAILCMPEVHTVTIERPQGLRRADVSRGPGWIGIVWPEGDEPTVRAFGSNGLEVHAPCRREFRSV